MLLTGIASESDRSRCGRPLTAASDQAVSRSAIDGPGGGEVPMFVVGFFLPVSAVLMVALARREANTSATQINEEPGVKR